MSDSVIYYAENPLGYTVPSFPSLTWPTGSTFKTKYFLYSVFDIWYFTVSWTLIFFFLFHITAGTVIVVLSRRNSVGAGALIVFCYVILGSIEAFCSSSIIGFILGCIYNYGAFHMSTWIPFCWALIQQFVLIITSYSYYSNVL